MMNSQNTENINVTIYTKQNTILKKFSMRKGGNLWVWLRKNGVPIGSACSGVGVCGACAVQFCGTPPHLSQNAQKKISISPQNAFEQSTLQRNGKKAFERLTCLTRVYSDIEITAEYW